jgi:anti-sigma regulatory factor (Ser/Thr protein kinase)
MTGRAGTLPGSPVTDPGMIVPSLTSRPALRMSALDPAPLNAAVPKARLHARRIAREWGFPLLAGDCELIVAELVTNAVEAVADLGSAAGPPPVRLRLTCRHHGVRIEVWDGSNDMPDTNRNRSARW